jgi:thiamine phosphate synthase YjbQ (UPF0047 family)
LLGRVSRYRRRHGQLDKRYEPVTAAVEGITMKSYRNELDFGTWEQIFYGEFDGRRDKRVLVKIIGE